MRIISGRFGGQRLRAAVPASARPTSDRVREALFSALMARGAVEGRRVLDLFAGTGALGFEALSRGATSVVAVERDARAIAAIKENARGLGLGSEFRAVRADVRRVDPGRLVQDDGAGGRLPFDLVFADPPYAEWELACDVLAKLTASGALGATSLLVLEHAAGDVPPEPDGLLEQGRYRYGDTGIVLYAPIA